MVDRRDALEAEIRRRSRGRLELLACAITPDACWAATLLRTRGTGYWLESLYEHGSEGWLEHTTSNGSTAWNITGEDAEGTGVGVLRFYGEAPPGASCALVRWRGATHEVPVQNGHFAFVCSEVTEHEDLTEIEVAAFR
jgi:hypothetical protein